MSYGSSPFESWILNEDEALPLFEHAFKRDINTRDTVHFPVPHLLPHAPIPNPNPKPLAILPRIQADSKMLSGRIYTVWVRARRSLVKRSNRFNIPRSRLVIMTKCFFGIEAAVLASGHIDLQMLMTNDGPVVNRVGLSRKHILHAVDASVEK